MAVEVSRTLVKSPPELWAELENAERLGRWLGEIRVTRVEAESKIEFEGDALTGSVAIEPSGWGTRVRLEVEPVETSTPRGDSTTTEERASAATQPAPGGKTTSGADTTSDVDTAAGGISASGGNPAVGANTLSSATTTANAADKIVEATGFWRRVGRRFLGITGGGAPNRHMTVGAIVVGENVEAVEAVEAVETVAADATVETVTNVETAVAVAADEPVEIAANTAGEPPEDPTESLERRLTAMLDDLGSAHKRPFSAA